MDTHEAISLYLKSCEGELSPRTVRQHAGTLYRLPNVPLDQLTAVTLRDWRSRLHNGRGMTLSAASANTYMKRVRAFLHWCELSGHTPGNPARLLRPLTAVPKKRLYLKADQLAALLDTTEEPRDRGALAVSRELLLRAGEIAMLRVRDLDPEVLHVTIQKKQGVYVHDEMPVTESLREELGRWLGAYRAAVGPLHGDYFLFPSLAWRLSGPGRVATYSPRAPMAHPERIVARALAAIGVVTERAGFHDLRRSMARLRYDQLVQSEGKDDALAVVSALLHHDSRRTTELYLGVDGDRTRRNAVMRSAAWAPVTPATATPANTGGEGLATVIPMTR